MNWLEQTRYLVEEAPAFVAAAETPDGLSETVAEGLFAVMPSIDSVVLIGIVVTGIVLIIGAMLVTALVLRSNRGLGRRLTRLESELTVYTEASTRVAQTLEAVLLGRTRTSQTMHSSRRYLLLQARERLHRGESPQGIARGLALSHDEVRLLEHVRRSGPLREPEETQMPQSKLGKREGFARPISVELPERSPVPQAPDPAHDRQWGQG